MQSDLWVRQLGLPAAVYEHQALEQRKGNKKNGGGEDVVAQLSCCNLIIRAGAVGVVNFSPLTPIYFYIVGKSSSIRFEWSNSHFGAGKTDRGNCSGRMGLIFPLFSPYFLFCSSNPIPFIESDLGTYCPQYTIHQLTGRSDHYWVSWRGNTPLGAYSPLPLPPAYGFGWDYIPSIGLAHKSP